MLAAIGRFSSRTTLLGLVAGLLATIVVAVTAPATAAPAASSGRVLRTLDSPIGKVLTDSEGRTVYLFAADKAGRSACSGACLRAWPAVIAPARLPASLPGVAGTLGVLKRPDGKRQLTIDGHPLYLFAGDSARGDLNGQGVDGFGARWWAVSPAGKAVTTMPTGSGQDSGPSGGSDGGSSGGSDDYAY